MVRIHDLSKPQRRAGLVDDRSHSPNQRTSELQSGGAWDRLLGEWVRFSDLQLQLSIYSLSVYMLP